MISVEERIAEVVILVREFHCRRFKYHAFLYSVMLGEGSCRDVSDYHFQRNDRNLLYNGVPVVQFFNIVSRDSFGFQILHEHVGHSVVYNAFALNGPLLEAVESCSIILV